VSPEPTLTEAEAPGRQAGEGDETVDLSTAATARADEGPDAGDDTPAAAPTVRQPAARPRSASGAPALVTAEDLQSRRQRKQARRLRARKVKRVVRRLDAWSVLKVSFIFYLCVYAVSLVSSVILWNVADRAGVIENIESFIEDLGAFETFEFVPDELLRGVALAGAVLAVLATGLTALGAVLFNLISDLVGGIRLTVIEEPGARPAVRPRKAAKLAARTDPAPVAEPRPERRPVAGPVPASAPSGAGPQAIPDAPPA
jgi:hypothetical protein